MLYDSKEIKSTLNINYFIIRHQVVLLLMNQHNPFRHSLDVVQYGYDLIGLPTLHLYYLNTLIIYINYSYNLLIINNLYLNINNFNPNKGFTSEKK